MASVERLLGTSTSTDADSPRDCCIASSKQSSSGRQRRRPQLVRCARERDAAGDFRFEHEGAARRAVGGSFKTVEMTQESSYRTARFTRKE
jgi:hypothetical protein